MKGSLHFLDELSDTERSWSFYCRHQFAKLLADNVFDDLTDRREVRDAGIDPAIRRCNPGSAGEPLVMVRPREEHPLQVGCL